MKDCKGKELYIEDYVVFIRGKNNTCSLDTGHITNIYKNRYGEYECSVGSQAHIYEYRVLKI